MIKVLGVVAAGIGVTGAVAVVGASILWVRFDAIGVPATQAVNAMPKAELVVQGGQEVIVFVLIALAAALAIALADPKGIITWGTLITLGALVVVAVIYALETTLGDRQTLALIVMAVVLALACIGIGFSTGQRLLPILVAVFLAALVFSSTCALLIVENQKYAQAVAIYAGPESKKDAKGVTGIYVTATDTTIFFARSDAGKSSGTDNTGLYEAHRTENTTYAVGPLEQVDGTGNLRPVDERAKALLAQLKENSKNLTTEPPAGATGATGTTGASGPSGATGAATTP
ncbi:MAG TPA: hypothetical protein VII45_11980 [Solirubrobacterales bacterium]